MISKSFKMQIQSIENPDPETLRQIGEVLFFRLPSYDREEEIRSFIHLIQSRELRVDGIRIARTQSQIVGVLVGELLPGKSGVIHLPQVICDQPIRIEDALYHAIFQFFLASGVKLLQAFLLPEEFETSGSLIRNGFRHITRAWQMQCSLSVLDSSSELGFTWSVLNVSNELIFENCLLASYIDTQDCPELNGIRSIDEIMTGLRRTAHDPSRWWIIEHEHQPIGVVILANGITPDAWELAYFGLIPQVRGKGFGRAILRQSLSLAKSVGMEKMTLMVDSRNQIAMSLYRSVGFEIIGAREVFLRIGL
jgi:mycothiol synthase